MRGSPRMFCPSPCGHMSEEKREAVMAIEGPCLLRPMSAVRSNSEVTPSLKTVVIDPFQKSLRKPA
jgi:hypothetical protein